MVSISTHTHNNQQLLRFPTRW